MKKGLILILALVLGVIFAIYKLGDAKKAGHFNNQEEGQIREEQQEEEPAEQTGLEDGKVYVFVGEGCPACEKLLGQIEEKKLGEKVNLEVIEVFRATENQKFYLEAYERCGKDTNDRIAVPVVYYKGECFDESYEGMLKKLEDLAQEA